MAGFRKYLKNINPTYFFIPFIAFGVIALSYVAVQSVFFPKNQIFPKGVRYVPDQIIVKYKPGQSPEELSSAGKTGERENLLSSLKEIGVVSQKKLFDSESSLIGNYYVLSLKKGISIPDAYKQMTRVPQVENAAPDYILKVQEAPNDPYYPQMWNLPMMHLSEAWDLVHTNKRATVAVIDTGVDYNHEDLSGVVTKGKNFIAGNMNPLDDQGHGTHVAGTIGGVTNNGIGISGVSWGAKILAIKACDKNGDCNTTNVSKAVQYAVDSGVKIINISIAGAGSCNGTYADVMKYATRHGALVISAAGNGNNGDGVGVNADTQIPAACDGVMAVGAVKPDGLRSPFSNYGSRVQIAAPGGVGPCSMPTCILSTSLSNGYSLRSGTSMAAPHVSGVAALLLASNSALTAAQIRTCLVNGAERISTDHPIGPLLDARGALVACAKKTDPTPTSLPNETSAISGTVFVDSNNNNKMDKTEKPFPGAQVVLSGLVSDSALSNSKGRYIFSDLTPGLYTVSLTVNGTSVGNPVDITLTQGSSVQYNFPVPPSLAIIPTPTVGQQKTASECRLDPSCANSKDSFQICSFQCSP